MQRILALALYLTWASSSLAVGTDEDGCWSPPDYCLQVSSEWKDRTDRFVSRYRNVCEAGIVLTVCHEIKSSIQSQHGWSHPYICGQLHVSPGDTDYYDTPASWSTGRSAYSGIGSVHTKHDWVCLGKIDSTRANPGDYFR
jgi:hypothetical protein